MEEIIQSYHYKMDALSKIQKERTSDTYNGRKQEEKRTELRKLGEALQHLQNKRCRFELISRVLLRRQILKCQLSRQMLVRKLLISGACNWIGK